MVLEEIYPKVYYSSGLAVRVFDDNSKRISMNVNG